MAQAKVEFNLNMWYELVTFVERHKTMPSIEFIRGTWKVSSRTASAYFFALNNRFDLYDNSKLALQTRTFKNKVSALTSDLKQAENTILEQQAKIDFLEAIELIQEHKFRSIRISQKDMSTDEQTAISVLGDVHFEEVVEPSVVNNLNAYNPAEATKRLKRYFSRLMFLIRSMRAGGRRVNHLVLGFLGDMITGYIHEELIESNAMSPTEAVVALGGILSDGLKFLSEDGDFESIKVVMIRGNHGRTSKRKKFSTGYKNSYEQMMYNQIHRLFKETLSGYDNLEFVIPKGEFAYVDIYETTNSFSHGDHFRYAGGIGGVIIPFQKWIYRMNQIIPANMRFIQHWHQYTNIPGGAIGGSVIGYNAFAMGIGAKPEEPKMQLQIVDSKRGYTTNEPIILVDW